MPLMPISNTSVHFGSLGNHGFILVLLVRQLSRGRSRSDKVLILTDLHLSRADHGAGSVVNSPASVSNSARVKEKTKTTN